MKLRAKTFIAIAVTVLVLVVVQYALIKEIVEGGFEKVSKASISAFSSIEDRDARRNVDRVTDALAYRVETLATKAADWSQWDDTYKYIKDKNRAFVESNLGDDALSALKINLLLLIDEKAQIVYSTAYDLEDDKTTDLPASLRAYIRLGGALLAHESPEHLTAGILSLPEGPLMIVSRPIVKSNGEGPMRGSVIFGRFLDDAELKQLASLTHLSIVVCYTLAGSPPDDFQKAMPVITASNPIHISPENDQIIRGYTSVKDIEGKANLYLRVDIDREIHRQGVATGKEIRDRGAVILTLIVGSLLLTGVVVCLVIGMITERWVLSRLAGLSRKTEKIGALHDFSLRVKAEGKDEIASLGQSINHMLEALESAHSKLEISSAGMRLLMDTVPAGLLSIDEQGKVNPEYSKMAESLFGRSELAGFDFVELLGLTGERAAEGRELMEFLDVMRQDLIDEESMAGLNPLPELELWQNDIQKWLRLGYYLIRRGEGLPNHLLAVVEDITEQKRLSAQVSKTERENLQLKAIAEDPELFREFLIEAEKILRAVEQKASQLDLSEATRPLVNDIFRGVHTIKGVAGSFGLSALAQASGELEESLEPLRKTENALTGDMIAETRVALAALTDCFGKARSSARTILGEDGDADGGIFLRVSSAEIARHMKELSDLGYPKDSGDAAADLLKREALARFAALRSVPARRGLARALRIVPGLIERLAKDAVFKLNGAELPIDCEVARELNTPLVHMIRNAIDHGIEEPVSRTSSGKAPTGTVTLHIDRSGNWLTMKLSDDGKGLDPQFVRSIAVKKGLLTEGEAAALTDAEALELIFKPGFTTAEEVSEISGRGVGMDAVRHSIVENLRGSINVASEKGKGTAFTIRVPIVPQ